MEAAKKKKKKQAMRLDLRGDKYWLGCTLLTKTMCPCPLLLQQSLGNFANLKKKYFFLI